MFSHYKRSLLGVRKEEARFFWVCVNSCCVSSSAGGVWTLRLREKSRGTLAVRRWFTPKKSDPHSQWVHSSAQGLPLLFPRTYFLVCLFLTSSNRSVPSHRRMRWGSLTGRKARPLLLGGVRVVIDVKSWRGCLRTNNKSAWCKVFQPGPFLPQVLMGLKQLVLWINDWMECPFSNSFILQ